MIKNIFLLIITFSTIFAADLTNFDTRQSALQDIKKVVQSEESIARAYEQYILDNYDIPSSISVLYTSDYLGSSTDYLGVVKNFDTNFNAFSLGLSKLSYALKSTLSSDDGIKALYEGNTFRKRTFYRNEEIYFIFEDAFAKHLFDLIEQNGSKIINCPNNAFSTAINCKENNHIYLQLTKKLLGTEYVLDTYLMAYHIDNFRKGPIVITANTSLHDETEFNSIPRGALLIDTSGIKYVKTTSSIEALK